jgi:carboxyl-terminal processing protease
MQGVGKEPRVQQPETKRSLLKGGRTLVIVVIGLVYGLTMFAIGIGYARGSITLGPDAAFRQPVDKGVPVNLDYASVEAVYDKIRADYDGTLDQQKLLDGLKEGLAQATGDPYTEYFSAKDAKSFNEQLSGTFSGIGAELGKDKNGSIVVIAPIAGFPAEKAGLKAKDVIISVDGKSTAGLAIDEAVGKIRGPSGTKVTLKVVRNAQEELSFEITRTEIKLPSVTSEITADNIGILKISRFGEDTVQLSREAAEKFKAAQVRGVVVDLRDDPGGLLEASVGVSSLWLERGKTVLQEKRGGKLIRTYRSQNVAPPLKGMPTVVLINEGSASASEITAGALHDNKAATLMGVKSYGKGSVQQIECLEGIQQPSGACPSAFIKITIARWYTPNGRNIDKQGIEPNQKIERTDDDVKNGVDPQQEAAVTLLKK